MRAPVPGQIVYAAFGRRLAALAVDAAVMAVVLVGIVHGVNAVSLRHGAVFVPFWIEAQPVRTFSEVASRDTVRERNGSLRETTVSRETRQFPDGTLRIYAVADSRITAPDGTVTTAHAENLIGRSAREVAARRLTLLLFAVVPFLYFAIFESSPAQGTPGKLALGLKVTDREGRRIGLGRSLVRQLLKCAELASSGITYLIAAFTERRQALHDMFAGTVVVHVRPAESAWRVRRVAT